MADSNSGIDWKPASLKTLDLLLDRENPRIPILPNETQANIRRKLLETMEIIELAKEIIENKGLLAGERIIACVEKGSYVVLEGNRRTTACQLLLDPNLIPKEFLGRFPSAPSDVRAKILRINADVAPDRVSAEITITKKHTKNSALKWTPEAQHRRIKRMIDAGRSIEEIKALFGLKTSELVTRIREGELLSFARSLPWSAKEAIKLHETNLQTNSFTRFFTLKGVRDTLGISFSSNGVLQFENSKQARAKRAMKHIARAFLLPTATGKPAENSRTKPVDLFQKIERADGLLRGLTADVKKAIAGPAMKQAFSPKTVNNAAPSGKSRSTTPNPPTTPQPVRKIFFEDLTCKINNHQLIALTSEIRDINYLQFPIAAAFLTRALLESGLRWCIDETGQSRNYKTFWKSKNERSGLQAMIKFCREKQYAVDMFSDVSAVVRTLGQWEGAHKDYCDLIIHGEWLAASQPGLDLLAADTRPLVERILNGSILLNP